jgi:signal transduction histidine kinase
MTEITRSIAPGEIGKALLHTYEEEFGPAVGSDIAFAVERYAKTGGYFPSRDTGVEGLQRMQRDFREHLSQNSKRFSHDFGAWLARHHPSRVVFPHLKVGLEEAAKRAKYRMYKYFAEYVGLCMEHEFTIIIPMLTGMRNKVLERFQQELERAHEREIWMIQAFAEPARSFQARSDVEIMDSLSRDISSTKHELVTLSSSRAWRYAAIKANLRDLSTQKRNDVSSLEKTIYSGNEIIAKWAIRAYREHLVHCLRQIDRGLMTPLEELITRHGEDHASLAEALEEGAYVKRLEQAIDAQLQVFELWGKRLKQMRVFLEEHVPKSEEMLADISHAIHPTGTWLQSGIDRIDLLIDEIEYSIDPTPRKLDRKSVYMRATINRWRKVQDGISDQTDIMITALDYAEDLGARVVRKAEPHPDMDDQILRKILAYPIGNALQINGDGEYEIVVTVRDDSIEIWDNGIGMKPDRLIQLRQAIEKGQGIKSDHGGTGRGLAMDVGQNLLPKLFPNAPDRNSARLSIDSTYRVGTRLTIHFPPSVVAKGR